MISEPAARRNGKVSLWVRRYGFALLAAAALVLLAGWIGSVGRVGVAATVAMAIGGGVGLVEIMGRYKHAPLRAALSPNGAAYLAVNVAASGVAFYLVGVFQPPLSAEPNQAEVQKVLLAGFGALVFLRSSIFKVRVGDFDVGVGPSAILDSLHLIADRGVDRREAVARAQDVSALVAHIKDPRVVAAMLTKYSLALMQNVDEKVAKDLGEAIGKVLSDPDIPDTIKMDIVALRLGIVVGPDVLEAAVQALGDRLNAVSSPIVVDAPAEPPALVSTRDLKSEVDAARSRADQSPRQPAAPANDLPAA